MSDITPEKAQELLDGTTPGPWKVCETTIHGRKYSGCWVEGPDVDDGDGMPRGVLIPMTGSGGAMSYTTRLVDIQDHDHNDANAHLIAAAPDLARAYIAQAAEILRLRARVGAADRLVEAMQPFAEHADTYPAGADWHYPAVEARRLNIGEFWKARAALTAYKEAAE